MSLKNVGFQPTLSAAEVYSPSALGHKVRAESMWETHHIAIETHSAREVTAHPRSTEYFQIRHMVLQW